MHILLYLMGTKATRRKAAVYYAAHSLSRGNQKVLCLDPSLLCVPALLLQFQAQ